MAILFATVKGLMNTIGEIALNIRGSLEILIRPDETNDMYGRISIQIFFVSTGRWKLTGKKVQPNRAMFRTTF